MEQKNQGTINSVCGNKGFTVAEVLVVLALLTIISTIAVPAYAQWLNNAEYRMSARSVLYALREARSKAITTNLEHRVEFESVNRKYRVMQGNRASNSSDWSIVVYDWTILPPQVHMQANVEKIHLNPTGTANAGTIKIQDAAAVARYEVRVANTGRIRIP